MTSYPETLTVKKLLKMDFFIIKIYYISSSNDPNITLTKRIIFGVSCTLTISYFGIDVNESDNRVLEV
jgi:hypothetical protein